MARLPAAGEKNWGPILDEYLQTVLSPDGGLNIVDDSASLPSASSVDPKKIYFVKNESKIVIPNSGQTDWDIVIDSNKVVNQTTEPTGLTTEDAGTTYYNTTENKMYVWDGSGWSEIGTGGGVSGDTITSPQTYTPAKLVGGTSTLAETFWQTVSNGSFRINLNGVAYDIDGIDFTGNTTYNDVTSTIQTRLRADTSDSNVEVIYNVDHFEIISGDTTISSSISALTPSQGVVGTDISGTIQDGSSKNYLDCATNATVIEKVLDRSADEGKVPILNESGKINEELLTLENKKGAGKAHLFHGYTIPIFATYQYGAVSVAKGYDVWNSYNLDYSFQGTVLKRGLRPSAANTRSAIATFLHTVGFNGVTGTGIFTFETVWNDNITPSEVGTIRFGMGVDGSGNISIASFSEVWNSVKNFVGFSIQITGSTKVPYCTTADGSAVTNTTFSANTGTSAIYRVEIDYTLTTPEVRFYRNGVLLATHTTNLPSSLDSFGFGTSGYAQPGWEYARASDIHIVQSL